MAVDLPTVVNQSGLVPQTPAQLWALVQSGAIALSPGVTNNLPGLLIEDITSTDVAAVSEMDSARVETVDSATPYGANAWLLTELGQIYGVPLGQATNTSVQVIFFSEDAPGYIVQPGTQVSDGTYVYVVQNGGVIQSNFQSQPLTCTALLAGSWAIPAGTVTQITTSIPSIYGVTCSNPFPGTPGAPAPTQGQYRGQVLQAGLASGIGMPSYLKTQLQNVTGVQPRLISVKPQTGGGWKVICGGGDDYATAFAILIGVLDISTLVGSSLAISNITNATNAQVTTTLNHGYQDGQICEANGVLGMTGINGVPLTVTVVDEKNFTTGVNSNLFGSYTSGGTLTPNLRNVTVSLVNWPDIYTVPYINPPQQTVTISLTWNTTALNFINVGAVQQLGAPALAGYVNSIYVGQPINLFEAQTVFQQAIASVLNPNLLTRMVWAVSINGVSTAPLDGTAEVVGDPESYFYMPPDGSAVSIVQG